MSVPRSHSLHRFTSVLNDAHTAHTHARPALHRHRSAAAIHTPLVEKEDPFSLSSFFPARLVTLEHSTIDQEWDWLRISDSHHNNDDYHSGAVSSVSESDDEWNPPTPGAEDTYMNEAIKHEDKLGILAFSTDSFLPSRDDEHYVEAEECVLLSPLTRPGDPLDADAVVDALRALRTAYSLPSASAAKANSAALNVLFSPEKKWEDKVEVETGGWGALVSWGVSRVEELFSPQIIR